MAAATVDRKPPASKCPALVGLAAYLHRCGGKDTLHFETSEEAGDAAQTIRGRGEPGVDVYAQYYRVVLTLRHE